MEAVLGHVPVPVERSLAKLAHIPVAGAFVSLKWAGQLRSCCGSLGQPAPLYQAIEHAAVAAAKEDRRFPPISPVELPYLEVDVWLLGTLQPVAAKGAVRRNAVVIGKHGLQISRGNRRGLLLPVVAVERQLDAEGFLDLVCHKAGLPVDAWLDDNAVLMTFQGHSIKGELKTLWEDPPQPSQVDEQMEKAFPRRVELDMDAKERHEVTALEATPGTAARWPGPGRADVALLADVCRKNVQALLTGATPAFYVPAAFDGGVQGIVLSLQLPGKADRIDCSQFNILGQIPLQSTLFELAKAAAGLLQRSGVTPAAIPAIAMDLTILWDAAMHGSPDAPQLRGLDPGQRALFVAQQNRWAWSGTPRRRRKSYCAMPSIGCGRPALRTDRCSAWQSFPPPIGLRSPTLPSRGADRTFARRRLPDRSIRACRGDRAHAGRLVRGQTASRALGCGPGAPCRLDLFGPVGG